MGYYSDAFLFTFANVSPISKFPWRIKCIAIVLRKMFSLLSNACGLMAAIISPVNLYWQQYKKRGGGGGG